MRLRSFIFATIGILYAVAMLIYLGPALLQQNGLIGYLFVTGFVCVGLGSALIPIFDHPVSKAAPIRILRTPARPLYQRMLEAQGLQRNLDCGVNFDDIAPPLEFTGLRYGGPPVAQTIIEMLSEATRGRAEMTIVDLDDIGDFNHPLRRQWRDRHLAGGARSKDR